jgi:hypothetical protein
MEVLDPVRTDLHSGPRHRAAAQLNRVMEWPTTASGMRRCSLEPIFGGYGPNLSTATVEAGGPVDGGLPATGKERENYDAQRSAFGMGDLLPYVRRMGLDRLDTGPEEEGSDAVGARRSPASAPIGRPAS